jgi:hypothetical protein
MRLPGSNRLQSSSTTIVGDDMKAIDKAVFPAERFEQVLEMLLFAVTAVLVASATVAMCLPRALGQA